MALDEGISQLIGEIYAGAFDSAIWLGAMETLVERTDSRFSLITVVDTKTGKYNSTQIVGPDNGRFSDGVREYSESVFMDDPTLRFGLANPNAGSVRLLPLLAGSGVDTEKHAFVRWHVGMMSAGDCQVRYTAPRGGVIFGVSLAAKAENRVHGADDMALFAMLFGHIRSALELAIRPPDFTSATEARLLLDARGRVLAVSPAAEAVLARRDGLAIFGGALQALRPAESRRIAELVRSAAEARLEGGCGGAMALPRSSGRRDYLLLTNPLPYPPGPFADLQPCVEVRVVDPDAAPDNTAPARWRQLFGLTPAEARLAKALIANDCDLRRAAEACGVTYATARTQLASIFRKTDVRSKSHLVRVFTLTAV